MSTTDEQARRTPTREYNVYEYGGGGLTLSLVQAAVEAINDREAIKAVVARATPSDRDWEGAPLVAFVAIPTSRIKPRSLTLKTIATWS